MGRTLQQELHLGIVCQLRVLVAVVRTEEPAVAVLVDLADRHRPHGHGAAFADARAEKAARCLLRELLDLAARLASAEVAMIFFRLIAIDAVHPNAPVLGRAPAAAALTGEDRSSFQRTHALSGARVSASQR